MSLAYEPLSDIRHCFTHLAALFTRSWVSIISERVLLVLFQY